MGQGVEDLRTGERTVCATAFLTFVALDEEGRPHPVPNVIPETDLEKSLHAGAPERANIRNKRKKESRRLAKDFGISSAAVSHISNGNTWKHLTNGKKIRPCKNYRGKLNKEDIFDIRKLFKEGLSDTEIAKIYGLHRASIYNIRNGKSWKNY